MSEASRAAVFSYLRRMRWRALTALAVVMAVLAPSLVVDAPASAGGTPGPVSQIVFVDSPSSASGGLTFSTQPEVEYTDSSSNLVTTENATITLTAIGPSGATLAGCSTSTPSGGIADFSGCLIDAAANGYQLKASGDGVTGTSTAFNVNVGTPALATFTTQPSDINAGVDFPSSIAVQVTDAGGNVVTSSTDDVGLFVNPSSDALTCTGGETTQSSGGQKLADGGVAEPLALGVATFPDCTVAQSVTGSLTLDAVITDGTTDGTFEVSSNQFTVMTGTATKLGFTTEPTGAVSGFDFNEQPVVAVEDSNSNVVTSATGTVTLQIEASTNPGNAASLTCTSEPLVAGVAYFSGCAINTLGTGYVLTATDNSLSGTSNPFDVSTSGVGGLSFAIEPGDGDGGAALATEPEVSIKDTSGQYISGTVQLTLTDAAGHSVPGASLTCTDNPTPAGEGLAQFAGCSVNKDGTYKLLASDPDDPTFSAESTTFTVSTGSAAQLSFVDAPDGATGGTAFGTQPTLALQDLGGNDVASSDTVQLSIASGTGTPGAALTCSNNPVAISATTDVAAFAGCSIDKAGVGYELTATSAGFVTTSAPFDVTIGTASRLVFVTEPSGGIANSVFGTQPRVAVADAGGNPIGSASATVSLTISTGTISCAQTTLGTESSTGVATFENCAATTVGTGETLTATASGLASATSATFTVRAGTPLGAVPVSLPLAESFGGATYGRNPTETVDDVNTMSGDLTVSDTDLTVAGIGVDLTLTRTYNSQDLTGGSFGAGWTSILDAGVTIATSGATATVRGADGQRVVFASNGHGQWVAPAGARETLTCAATSCTVKLFDGQSFTSVGGRIQSFLSADGQGLKFEYTGARLTEVLVDRSTTALVVTVTENGAGEVTNLSTPARTVSYGYTAGLLTSYTDANGNTWTYGYVAGGLYQVTDPDGELRLLVSYTGARVATAESFGGPGLFDDSYQYAPTTTTRAAVVQTSLGLVASDYVDTYKNGALVAQETPMGGVTAYSYDAQFDLTEMQNPLGLIQTMTYDAVGDILSQSMPFSATKSAVTTFAYNASHQMTSETDPNGDTTTYQYTGANLTRSQPPAPAGATTYKYNSYGERTEADGPLGITTYAYDAAGNQTGFQLLNLSRVSLDGLGPVTTFNEAGQVLTQTDARGHTLSGTNAAYTTTYVYDADGNQLSTTTPGPETTSTIYNAAGDPASTTSSTGVTTILTWDQVHLTSTSSSPAGTTTTVYDPSGDVLTNAQGQIFTYDQGGDELTLTGTDGVITSYIYNAAGDVIGSSDNAGHVSTFTYGTNGQLATSDVDGVVSTTTYDPDGNVLTQTDNAGHVTRYTYNADELVASVTTAAGTTSYVYDGDGNVVQMIDGDRHITYYTYNGANERTAMVVNGSTWTYQYDAAGNLIGSTDPMSRTTSYVLNAEDLPTSTTYSEPGQSTITVTDTYNAAGQRTSMSDPSSDAYIATYSYDSAGNLTEMNNGPLDTFTYNYTTPGQMTETYPDGHTVTYTYDDEHNVMSVSSGAVDVSYLRNASRQVVGATYSNGLVETEGYNEAGEQTSASLSCAGSVVVYSATSYDADGNPLASLSTDGQTTTTDSYGYDGSSRVADQSQSSSGASTSWDPGASCTDGTETTPSNPNGGDPTQDTTDTSTPGTVGGIEGFTATAPTSGTSANPIAYDAVGNQLSDQGTTSTYNNANELVSSTGSNAATYVYDASGDLTSKTTSAGTTTYGYNAANELVSVTTATSTTTYSYDGDGNRITKSVTGTGAMSELYVWDINATTPLLAEETTTGGTLTREYIYGVGPVAMVTPTHTYYLTTDATGDVTDVSNESGALLESINYSAFGSPTVTTIDGATPVTEPILFQSQYLDPTTGLYDLRARNYDPTTGRFTQRDAQIAETGTPVASPYVYAGDQPTTQADPTGESFSSAADSAFDGHSTESASIVADASYGVKAIKVGLSAVVKISAYMSKAESAASEATDVLADSAPEAGELAAEEGADVADVAGKALGVIGIGLGVYVTYEDCNSAAHGGGAKQISQCVGDAVGVAISAVCLVATEGIGSVACGLAGAALAIVISEFGPQITEGLADLGNYAAEGATYVYQEVSEGFTDAGDAISAEYDSIKSSVDAGFSALSTWASNAYSTALGAITTGFDKLGSEISSGFDSALSDLEKAGYTALQFANELTDQFNEGLNDVISWLNDLNYGATAVLGVLKNFYNETAAEAAVIMKDVDYTFDQIGTALTHAFSYFDSEVAGVFESIGATVDQIVNVLKDVFTEGYDAVAGVLNDLDYGFEEIGQGIQDVFQVGDSILVGVLNYISVPIGDIMQAIGTIFSSLFTNPLQSITDLFQDLGYTAQQVTQGLADAFKLIDSAIAPLLQTAGYALADIASALESVFTDGVQAVAQIFEDIGDAASTIESWLSNLPGEVTSTIESILSDIGFSSSVIDAIGGAFASFGSDVASAFESLGSDIASLF